MMRHILLIIAVLIVPLGCRNNSGSSSGDDIGTAPPVDPDCATVRLTAYQASAQGWCEFDRTLPILSNLVHNGLTLAIAEPWNNSSYQGDPGEACGECWEIDTIYGTETVLVHDLCPIQGNSLCAGGHFHFDLSLESATALGGGGLSAAVAKRVPCPVTGNVHVQINDWNQWGYIRAAFVNHRIPIRSASIQFSSTGEKYPMERSGGAWHLLDHPKASENEGLIFELTSAQDETITATIPIKLMDSSTNVFDTGVQFTDQNSLPLNKCIFEPPSSIYGDSWGGIDQVTWQPNPWGGASVSETSTGCYQGESCLRIREMDQWEGMHIYYREEFPPATFASLSLWVKAPTKSGTLTFSLSHDGERCQEKQVEIKETWQEVVLNPEEDCSNFGNIDGLTISNVSQRFDFLLDEIQFKN